MLRPGSLLHWTLGKLSILRCVLVDESVISLSVAGFLFSDSSSTVGLFV